jgi:hypothetical protein
VTLHALPSTTERACPSGHNPKPAHAKHGPNLSMHNSGKDLETGYCEVTRYVADTLQSSAEVNLCANATMPRAWQLNALQDALRTPLISEVEFAALFDIFEDDFPVAVCLHMLSRLEARHHLRLQLRLRDRVTKQQSYMYFMRPDLHLPEGSAWRVIYTERSEMALLNLTRLDWATFTYLCRCADPAWMAWRDGFTDATRTAARPGRPYNLDGPSCIALALAWLSTTAQLKYLELVFGCTHADVSRDLDDGMDALMGALRSCPEARVIWPSPETIERFVRLITSLEAYGERGIAECLPFAFVDGLRLAQLHPGDARKQNMSYLGWLHMVCVENILMFAPDGTIIDCILGLPGRWHDMAAATYVIDHLQNPGMNPNQRCALADDGFFSARTASLLATRDFQPLGVVVPPDARRTFQKWQTRARQPAEWGMRVLQGTWCRITEPLPTNDLKRNRILECVVLLHNLVARAVPGGHNQIRTVYEQVALRA